MVFQVFILTAIPVIITACTFNSSFVDIIQQKINSDLGLTAEAPTFTVTYMGHNSDGGTVPLDANAYEENASVTVLDEGNLDRDGFTFSSWNTASNGSGISYEPGETFSMGTEDVALYAQWYPDMIKLLSQNPADGANFGRYVDVSGDYAVVGASKEDYGATTEAGAAYVFHRTGTNSWGEATRLVATDPTAEDEFGIAVAIDGNYIIVGAWRNDNGGGSDSGAAYIFRRTGGNTWDTGTKIVPSDPNNNKYFGDRVDIDGEYAIIGATGDYDSHVGEGSAYIFHCTDTASNIWDAGTEIKSTAPYENELFGNSVAISGSYAVVGPYPFLGAGAAYFFHCTDTDNNTWDSGIKITEPSAVIDGAENQFGSYVAIDGDYAVVGADCNEDMGENAGAAYIFRRTDTTTWDAGYKLTAPNAQSGEFFGRKVSIAGDRALISAPGNDSAGASAGAVVLFHRTGTNTWDSGEKIFAFDAEEGDNFGFSVNADGNYAIVGAPYEDEGGVSGGAAYIHYLDWTEE